MVTTTGTQGQRQIFIRFWTLKPKFQTKINLSRRIVTRFQKISVYELRMDGIYRFVKKSIHLTTASIILVPNVPLDILEHLLR